MNISGIVNQINNSLHNTGEQPVTESALKSVLQNGSSLLESEGSGGFISGKIVSLDGNEIVLSLGPNAMINAKIEGNLLAQLGQNVSFIVNNQGNGKFSLSPLFENTAQSNTVNNALDAAGLPATIENQYMVKSMMQEGLSIDRNSLYAMSKAVSMNPEAEIPDLCKMTRLNIPTEPEMVQQFKNYTNFEHEVVNALKDISDSLSNSIPQNVEEISKSDLEFVKNSLEILLNDTDVVEEDIKEPTLKDNTVNENGIQTKESMIEKNPEANIDEAFVDFSKEKSIFKDMEILDFSPSVRKEAFEGTLSQKDFLKNVIIKINESIESEAELKLPKESKEAIKDILDSDTFKDILKQKIVEKYTLDPEEVSEEGRVSRLYEKLSEQIKSISESVNAQGKADTPFANSINNLNSNVEFMNQLNQTFNYVQIPLKMNGQDSTGELYVYTNKKKLSRDDGQVSALLHLDMDNLGPVDVHVTLNSANDVRTKFMLKDDASLDLIEKNIGILNERLEKRGYSMKCEFTHTDEPKSIMDTIIESSRNISVISSGSFDARA